MDFLCGIRIVAVDYFVLSQCTRLIVTDGQTDRKAIARSRDALFTHCGINYMSTSNYNDSCLMSRD